MSEEPRVSFVIQKLRLRDYRCFESIDIDFHKQLTVLVASNGAGKTSILDAIAVAFGPYVGAFDESVGKGFESSDIRLTRVRNTKTNEMEYAALGVGLEATGVIPYSQMDLGFGEELFSVSWERSLAGPNKKTTIKDAKQLIDAAKKFQSAVRTSGSNVTLPLLAYYGTGRLWQQKNLTQATLLGKSRTIGYTNCLEPGSSYRSFVAWFKYWSENAFNERYKANESGLVYEPTEFDHFIEAVSGAVNICLEPAEWKNISYSPSRKELVVDHDQHGQLPVSLLSDGIRNMIGMVADIAFRATKLNPHLGAAAAKKTDGVVLIDEVDMHLHPKWQQCVLQSLMSAFPCMQFIVSTHSPQVLSTVSRENIRVIGPDICGETIAVPPLAMTYGEPSGDVMYSVMDVDPQPPVKEKVDLMRLTELVDQGDYQSVHATQLMQSLLTSLGDKHPQLLKLQRSIQRQKALK
ncbi:MAG: AAA family ATPase [Limnobacter sp.]|uniref:AAA family ATPase n=1 Tax=Limnobacter sp. TaxID=2003368 RepID=UPI003001D3EB